MGEFYFISCATYFDHAQGMIFSIQFSQSRAYFCPMVRTHHSIGTEIFQKETS